MDGYRRFRHSHVCQSGFYTVLVFLLVSIIPEEDLG